MKGMHVTRVRDGVHKFVWLDFDPAPGSVFSMNRVKYRRDPERGAADPIQHGTDADFSRGPVTMWSEPLQGRGAVRAPHYDKNGFAVFSSNQQLRDYRAKSQDSKRPVEWTR